MAAMLVNATSHPEELDSTDITIASILVEGLTSDAIEDEQVTVFMYQ